MVLLLPNDHTKHLMPIGFTPGDAQFDDLVKVMSARFLAAKVPMPFAFNT